MGEGTYGMKHDPGLCHYCCWFGFHQDHHLGLAVLLEDVLGGSGTMLGAHWLLWRTLAEELKRKLGHGDFLIDEISLAEVHYRRPVTERCESWLRILNRRGDPPRLWIVVDRDCFGLRIRQVPARRRLATSLPVGYIELRSMERVYEGRSSARHPTVWTQHKGRDTFDLVVADTDGQSYFLSSRGIYDWRPVITVASPVSLLAAAFLWHGMTLEQAEGRSEVEVAERMRAAARARSYDDWLRMDRVLVGRGCSRFADVVAEVQAELALDLLSG